MKVIFSLLIILFFCFCTFAGLSENGIQKRKATKALKADSIPAKQKDSISNYSITINGELNAVSITKGNTATKNMETVGKPKKAANTIEINGEGNSVTINQNTKDSQVNVRQNGTGNRVNISQTKPDR